MAIGGVLFDIDGVLVTSWQPIPGAADALRVLADNRIAAAYLTNTTTRTRGQIAAALTTAGMTVRPDEVITAAALTADYVRTTYPDARCFLVNNGDITDDMPGIDIVDSLAFTDGRVPETPDVVLLGGAGPEYSHLTLSRVYEWMAQGVPVVAMHRSTAWTTTEGLRIDTGMYLIGMEETSGATPPPWASRHRPDSSPPPRDSASNPRTCTWSATTSTTTCWPPRSSA